MASLCRFLFFFGLVKPLALLVLGLNVRREHLLPRAGPAILVANHNSHLDTLVLLSLFPFAVARKIRPVAAADYFLRNRALAWFSLHVLRIIPVDRAHRADAADMARNVTETLAKSEIILLFPEGTRGEPEHIGQFRTGIAHLAKDHPEAPVVPVFLHGLGKALPRGEALLVPFFCDVFAGESIRWCGDRAAFMKSLEDRFRQLETEGGFPQWM
jgi:1-acyl-sn-glycerol-3-phosphate acyltransferase